MGNPSIARVTGAFGAVSRSLVGGRFSRSQRSCGAFIVKFMYYVEQVWNIQLQKYNTVNAIRDTKVVEKRDRFSDQRDTISHEISGLPRLPA